MINSKKSIVALALSTGMLLSTASAFAAGDITWKVKDYVANADRTKFTIVYEQYLDGIATGRKISGEDARKYGLKPYASSITRPNSWYDLRYPNYEYDEIFADGEYTGLVEKTGAQLPYTSYKDFPYTWEVGGTHKIIAIKKAFLNGGWFGKANYDYPSVYTGANADVKEENKYLGFDVFEIYEDGKARDIEVILDTEGEGVNKTNVIKAKHMVNGAAANTIRDEDDLTKAASITGLVNSGAGYNSVFYKLLAENEDKIVGKKENKNKWYETKDAKDLVLTENEVPVFDFTDVPLDYFDGKLPLQHFLHLSGPVYNENGEVADAYGKKIDAYEDCVIALPEDAIDSEVAIDNKVATQRGINKTYSSEYVINSEKRSEEGTGYWDYRIDTDRFDCYTNNIVTTGYDKTIVDKKVVNYATVDWVYAGYELSAPYEIYEYLSIEGIIFDGDIDNDGSYDTPVVFRYTGDFVKANPKVEWRYAFVERAEPHKIIEEKFVENMNGDMIATGEYRASGEFAKEQIAAVIDGKEVDPKLDVLPGHKHYQKRLEWLDKETNTFYVTPYYDIDEEGNPIDPFDAHVGDYIAIVGTNDPSYLNNQYDFVPGADVVVIPEALLLVNDEIVKTPEEEKTHRYLEDIIFTEPDDKGYGVETETIDHVIAEDEVDAPNLETEDKVIERDMTKLN